MKCQECEEEEATANIDCKNVCSDCFDRIKWKKNHPLKKSWLDEFIKPKQIN